MSARRPRLYKALLLLLAALLVTASFFSQRQLNHLRRDLGLTRLEPLKNAPPLLAITTVVLGGFRGLIANALWVRAIELQDEDKFFEKVQLADWITKLQPHNTMVWSVQAWDMSYNISIKFTQPAERWAWVRRGIELLRDEALKYNPQSVDIYRELAWHFQNKMGHNLDDAHLYYKSVWASEMERVLGKGHPDFDELIHPQTDEARGRAKLLREKYKMDPAIMKEVDLTYGPLEWRFPETHAIYWAYVGEQMAKNDKQNLIKLHRVIYQSMALAFHRGELLRNRNGTVEFGPNLTIADKTNKAFEQALAEDETMRESIGRAHKNFLYDAVYMNYVHNRISEAERWFKRIKELYPKDYRADLTLEEYCIGVRLQEDIGETDQNRITNHILGLLERSYWNLANDREDEAVGYLGLAKNVWNTYMNKILKTKSDKRVPLASLDQLKHDVVTRLLDPEQGLVPEVAAALRTKIPELAAQVDAELRARKPTGSTNAPPATLTAPGA